MKREIVNQPFALWTDKKKHRLLHGREMEREKVEKVFTVSSCLFVHVDDNI